MRDSEGFTLIEVLIAAAVLSLVLLGGAVMHVSAYGNLQQSGRHTTAAELGQQHMEWLRNQGYASADLGAGTTTVTLGGDYTGYTRTTIVQDATPRAGVKQVTVIMTTPSGISARATTLVAE
jgi:prepilin-type N-terminal cleavage/methylation domain-containing protein